ncbi:MAG: hypothetical protein C0490_25540, partial [Marivirga sp.]|nr:hypothetical protein [Marivirga sp.]
MKTLIISVVALFVAAGTYAQDRASIIKDYKKSFKTYGFNDPDPIARMGSIYPYYRFDGYTDKGVSKEWKVVELENDYIKLMVLP